MRTRAPLLVVAALLAAFAFASNIKASLTLTFDVSRLTYAWTGTATSPQFTVAVDGWTHLYVIGQPYAGGLGAITMPGGPITVTQFNSYFEGDLFFEAADGSANVIMNFPSILAPVAFFNNYSWAGATQAESTYVQVTGNGFEVSYAGVNPIVRDQISNMDGVPLYFRRNWFTPDTGPSPQNDVFPTQIGSIHVIPEPSTYALLAMSAASALWWARRRR
jgi:hypothetical protein